MIFPYLCQNVKIEIASLNHHKSVFVLLKIYAAHTVIHRRIRITIKRRHAQAYRAERSTVVWLVAPLRARFVIAVVMKKKK